MIRNGMRGLGFEPRNALSNESLNLARLTTPASPHFNFIELSIIKVWDRKSKFRDKSN